MVVLWIAGVAVSFGQILIATVAIRRMRRHSQVSPDRELAQSLAGSLGISEAVDILETRAAMPMTAGIFRPTIFLPCEARLWSLERRRVVLLHELAHVRRGDAATHLLARAALALHWWNPLAWTAWRRFIRERERAADDLVLGSGTVPADYAGHLLEIARNLQPAIATSAAALSMARRSELEGRLVAILDARVPRTQQGRAAAALAAALAIALVAPLASVRAESQTPQKPQLNAAAVTPNPEPPERRAARADLEAKSIDAQAALVKTEALYGRQSGQYVTALVELGDLKFKLGKISDANDYYTQSLATGDRPENFPALIALGRQNLLGTKVFKAGEADPTAQFTVANAESYFERARNAAQKGDDTGTAMTWLAWMHENRPAAGTDNLGQHPASSGEAVSDAAEAETFYRGALAVEDSDSDARAFTLDLFARFLKANHRDTEASAMQSQAAPIHIAHANALSSASTAAQVFKVGNGITAPMLLYRVEPSYSEQARALKVAGRVTLSVTVDTDGLAKNIQVTQALGYGLDEQAVEAVMEWKFKPATNQAGLPVPIRAQIQVNFRLL
jgi:TonB family protein